MSVGPPPRIASSLSSVGGEDQGEEGPCGGRRDCHFETEAPRTSSRKRSRMESDTSPEIITRPSAADSPSPSIPILSVG